MATIEELLPERSLDPVPDTGPEVVSLREAGPLIDVLSSETRRAILREIGAEPSTPGELADQIGTSVQNVLYHLSRLREVDLATVVGTRYSEKGREMDVYAATKTAIVIDGDDGSLSESPAKAFDTGIESTPRGRESESTPRRDEPEPATPDTF